MIFLKRSFYFLAVLMIPFFVHAQYSFQKEHDKYWVYRERLKNFMVSSKGTVCVGWDIPAQEREHEVSALKENIKTFKTKLS